MKYAKHISVLAAVVFLCAWYNLGASKSSTTDENPVLLAQNATGLTLMPKVEKISGGEIDWTSGVVRAVGGGKAPAFFTGRQAELMARRAAYVVAARNAALVLTGIRVGPGGRFENIRDGRIRANLTLTGFRELDATYDPKTRTATAIMEIPLCGVRGVVTVLGLKEDKPKRRWTWPKAFREGKPYDVIMIDARGMSCRPAVLPRLTTAEGQCVFDASETLAQGILEHPAARYVILLRDTNIPDRAEKHHCRCLTVKAKRIDKNGAIVLDKENLNILTSAPVAQKTLRKGKLLIVTSQ